jgi:guanosine-3',5'-bis(diphosphate) 3'-pyrophosphohydrolase
MNLILQAKDFAFRAHDSIGQVRKYSGRPYIEHPERVAAIVSEVTNDSEIIAAAWLHDVLEDVAPARPEFNGEVILQIFGPVVHGYVVDLTDQFVKEAYPNLNRKQRKGLERERIGKIHVNSKTVKLADLLDNSSDITENDADFARVYLREKGEMLPYLADGNSTLFHRAIEQLRVAKQRFGL